MTTKAPFLMVGIGEILWDFLPGGKKLGGAPANFAYHACQLGNRGVVVSQVGNDPEGRAIIDCLETNATPHIITTNNQYSTGKVSIDMDKKGIPSYTIHTNAAWDHLTFQKQHIKLSHSADVVCFGTLAQRNSISASAIQKFIVNTSPNCKKILDINLRQHYFSTNNIIHLLKLANILKLNDEELITLSGLLNIPNGLENSLLSYLKKTFNLELIILTKGSEGSKLYKNRDTNSTLTGAPLKVRDTVGAGDAFTAAIATGLCKGLPLTETHRLATRVASIVCEHPGATPKLPLLKDLLAEPFPS